MLFYLFIWIPSFATLVRKPSINVEIIVVILKNTVYCILQIRNEAYIWIQFELGVAALGAFIEIAFNERGAHAHVVVVPNFGFMMVIISEAFGWKVGHNIVLMNDPIRVWNQRIHEFGVGFVPDSRFAICDQFDFVGGVKLQMGNRRGGDGSDGGSYNKLS